MPIIANVIGGLGNQIFQYAAGQVLTNSMRLSRWLKSFWLSVAV